MLCLFYIVVIIVVSMTVLFYARDIISARKVINSLIDGFQDVIEDMKLEESLFWLLLQVLLMLNLRKNYRM